MIKLCKICGIHKTVKIKSVPQNSIVVFMEIEKYEKLINDLDESYFKEYREYVRKNNYSKDVYSEYLNSDEWKNIRDIRMMYDKEICSDCYNHATEVHHITYQRLGNEKLGDLVSLCNLCHKKRHQKIDEANQHKVSK